MKPLPAQDLRHNIGTYSVPDRLLPRVAKEMATTMPLEKFDPFFDGQYLETTYFDTADFDLKKARLKSDRYVTLRVRCYSPIYAQGSPRQVNKEVYALSAKTESEKFRVEIQRSDAENLLAYGLQADNRILPGNITARLMEIIDNKDLVPVVIVYFTRFAVEDDVDRLTLDVSINTDTGKQYPTSVLEHKCTNKNSSIFPGDGLRPMKISKFLWALQ